MTQKQINILKRFYSLESTKRVSHLIGMTHERFVEICITKARNAEELADLLLYNEKHLSKSEFERVMCQIAEKSVSNILSKRLN